METNRFAAILLLFATTAGCDTRDERAVKLATESANRQAEQNQVVAEMGREMTDNQRRIVEAVAESRKDLMTLQKEVAVQRDRLDAERKEIAAERRYESLLAVLAAPAGWIALAALPLVLCWLLLANLRQPPSDEDPICQLLVEELIHESNGRLPAPDSDVHKLRHDTD